MTCRASRSILIDARPEEVWTTLADFDSISDWGTGVGHSTLLTHAAAGVGAVRRVQVGRNTLRETIVGWDPPNRLSYTITGLPIVVRQASNTWTLMAEGSGTRVTLTSEVSVPRPPFVGRLVARRMASASTQLLAGLADHHRRTEDQS